MMQKRSGLAGCRYRPRDMLQLLVFLKTGRNVFLEIFDLALVVRTEVVQVYFPPLQLQIVSAGTYVMHGTFLVLKTADQHVLEPLQREAPALFRLFHHISLLDRRVNWLDVLFRVWNRKDSSGLFVGENLFIVEVELFSSKNPEVTIASGKLSMLPFWQKYWEYVRAKVEVGSKFWVDFFVANKRY